MIKRGINTTTNKTFLNMISKRFSNSNSNNNSQKDVSKLKEELIKLSLLNIHKYGWTEQSIKLSANELGYSNSYSCILKNGEMDLIYYTIDNWNDKLKTDLETISGNDKIIQAIKLRLSYEYPFINTWAQAIRLGMSPSYIKMTIERLITMSDIICSLDEEEEIREITLQEISASKLKASRSIFKRYLVIKIFLLAELHMLTDRSLNFKDTLAFIDTISMINFGIYDSFNNFMMINSAFEKILKYSFIALTPYDYSQVDEMLKNEMIEKKRENQNEEKNNHQKLNI